MTNLLTAQNLKEFSVFDDPVLINMRAQAERLLQEIMEDAKPQRWLSLLGGCGTGKTFLCNLLLAKSKANEKLNSHDTFYEPISRIYWPRMLNKLREGDYWRIDDAAARPFLLIDEVVNEHDPSGFAADKLSELFSLRCGKWTLVTSNCTLKKIAEIDVRLASRMVRGKSITVACETMDFALRELAE